jgi:hypothetical protein
MAAVLPLRRSPDRDTGREVTARRARGDVDELERPPPLVGEHTVDELLAGGAAVDVGR